MVKGWHQNKYGNNRYRRIRGTYEYDATTKTFIFTPGDVVNYYEIELTQDKTTIISAKWFKRVKKERWCAWKSASTFYAIATIDGKSVKMHRLLTDFQYKIVDHINGNGLFNIDENLRSGEHGVNERNQKNATGVTYVEGRQSFKARYVEYNGKIEQLGFHVQNYDSKDEAFRAASDWYHSNNDRVKARILQEGPCPKNDKKKRESRSSNSGEKNICDYEDKNGYKVCIERNGKSTSRWFSYTTRSKESALQEAIVFRDAFIAANPPKKGIRPKKQKTE